MPENPFRNLAEFASQICEEERQRDCSPNRLQRPTAELHRHLAVRRRKLERLRTAALRAGRETGHRQREVERRVVALFDLCIRLLLWEKEAPRLTAEEIRQRELHGSWTGDPSGEYLVDLINQFYPARQKVLDLAAAYDGRNGASSGGAVHQNGQPGSSSSLTGIEQAVLIIIRAQPKGKGIQGKEIISALRTQRIKLQESTLRRHILPRLKAHCGIRNERSRGGYFDPAI